MDQIVQPFDLQRLFVGDQPPLFYAEILFRTAFIYAYGLLLLRWLGSRTIGQLSTVEFLLVIALGSAVGDPMFYPQVPLFHAMAVITLVVLANKGLDILVARFGRAERAIDGEPVEIVSEGVIEVEAMTRTVLGQSELFQHLRHHGIEQLGEVRRAYLEPDGTLTVFRYDGKDGARPGLPIVPPWEISPPEWIAAGSKAAKATTLVCLHCGTMASARKGRTIPPCPKCGHRHWVDPKASGRSRPT